MKKIIVALLAASMCLSLLAGCGSKTNDSSEAPTTPEVSEQGKEQPEESVAGESSTPSGNVELRDFTMLGDDAFTTYYSATESMEEFYAWQALRKLEEAKGVNMKVEFVVDDQYQTTLQTRFAALNDIPMFVYDSLSEAEVLAMAENGIIKDIVPMLDKGDGTAKAFYSENDFGVTAANKVRTADGQMFWLPNIYISDYDGTYGVGTNVTVTIRQDWLDEYGLSMPTTIDEFTNALKTFNEKDPSSSGANVAGMNVFSYNPCNFTDGIAQWFGLVRGPIVNFNWDEGKAVSPWEQATVTDYFTYVRSLNEQGLYDSEMIGSNDTLRQKVTNNQVGAAPQYALATSWEPMIEAAFNAEGGGALYANMYPIEAVKGVVPLLGLEDPVYVWDQFVFTKELPDDELGCAFMDAYYSPEHIEIINNGVEGVNYKIVNGEKQWIQYEATVEGEGIMYDANQFNYLQEKADARISYGWLLYARNITPDMTYYQLGDATRAPKERGWAAQKTEYQEKTIDYGHWTSLDVNGSMATATKEESDIFNDLYNDLLSASQQNISSLVLGQSSVDDIPTMVTQLKDLGLDQLVQVFQARYNRFKGID